jgi:hypothetical protein
MTRSAKLGVLRGMHLQTVILQATLMKKKTIPQINSTKKLRIIQRETLLLRCSIIQRRSRNMSQILLAKE